MSGNPMRATVRPRWRNRGNRHWIACEVRRVASKYFVTPKAFLCNVPTLAPKRDSVNANSYDFPLFHGDCNKLICAATTGLSYC
jgi:hypothetical protein